MNRISIPSLFPFPRSPNAVSIQIQHVLLPSLLSPSRGASLQLTNSKHKNMFSILPPHLRFIPVHQIVSTKCGSWHQIVRNMAKGSPGQSQGKPRAGRNWRLLFPAGHQVREREVIARQRDLNYHPGLNVSDGTQIVP